MPRPPGGDAWRWARSLPSRQAEPVRRRAQQRPGQARAAAEQAERPALWQRFAGRSTTRGGEGATARREQARRQPRTGAGRRPGNAVKSAGQLGFARHVAARSQRPPPQAARTTSMGCASWAWSSSPAAPGKQHGNGSPSPVVLAGMRCRSAPGRPESAGETHGVVERQETTQQLAGDRRTPVVEGGSLKGRPARLGESQSPAGSGCARPC